MDNIKTEIIANYDSLIKIFEDIHNMDVSTLEAYKEFKTQFSELRKQDYEIAVTGTVSAGKSSFINSLLGRELLPRRKDATTNVATYIKHINKNPQGHTEGFIAEIQKNVDIDNLRAKLIENIKKERDKFNNEENKKLMGFLLANLQDKTSSFFVELIKAIHRKNNSFEFCNIKKGNDIFHIGNAKDKCKSISSFFEENKVSIEKYIDNIFEITQINGKLEDIHEYIEHEPSHNNKKHHVKSITLYCNAGLLEKGVVLIDLPGSDNKDKEDNEITHKILNSDSISAAIFLYTFGKDPTMEDVAISEVINNKVLRKKNKLFIVFNKTD